MDNVGWIKLHRKILDNPLVCKDTEYFCVWNYILLNAVHHETETLFGGKRIRLSCGQLVTSRKEIARFWRISDSKVERVLKALEIEHQIEQQASTKNRLITVLNWAEYQTGEQQTEQQVNNNRTASEQHKEEECKNDNNYIYIVSDETISRTVGDEKQRAVDAWNEMAKQSGLPVVTKLAANTKRANMLGARIQQYGIDDVIKAISNVGKSPFLRGEIKDWSCDFEWVMKPNNFPKVLEGNYNDGASRNNRGNTQTDAIERIREWGRRE